MMALKRHFPFDYSMRPSEIDGEAYQKAEYIDFTDYLYFGQTNINPVSKM